MRLLLKLRALKNQVYDLNYYHKLQGFIYRLFEGTPYERLHDRRGYKFFCFSNIFPPKSAGEKNPDSPMKQGDPRYLLISSPEVGLINTMMERITSFVEEETPVNVGEMSFVIKGVSVLKPRLGRSCTLITGTPIVLRIPKEKFESYGIEPEREEEKYVYWRTDRNFEPFVRQLEGNLFKKYKEFYGGAVDEFLVFEQFELIKRPVWVHTVLAGREVKFVGTLWKFSFGYLDRVKRRILEFGLDAGFGELNSLGFGFMNVVR